MVKEYKDYNECYEKFWKEIVEKDGVVNMDQVKRELSDYSHLLDQVPIVYENVTGGRITKPNTYAHDVIQTFEEINLDRSITSDDILEIMRECDNIEDLKTEILDYLK